MHKTVLLHECIDGLELKAGNIYLDCTVNGGGHSEEVARRFGNKVKIIGIDQDSDALVRSEKKLSAAGADFILKNANFRDLDKVLAEQKIEKVNGILFDLGWSSDQFENAGRGFSFRFDEPLSMSFKTNPGPDDTTAWKIVNEWGEESISDIIFGYGEERFSRRIAKKIVEARKGKPIDTTFDLVEIIKLATPYAYHRGKIHPATRTFQALRIAVNDELRTLTTGMRKAFEALATGGRMGIISFHSLEDRPVKQFYKQLKDEEKAEILTKKPITASDKELEENPRSRSAKLRILKKLI